MDNKVERLVDTMQRNCIICPYCGYNFSASYEYNTHDEECSKVYCGDCGERFGYTTHYTIVNYSSWKLEEAKSE